MSDRPVIPLKVKSGKPSPEVLAQLDRHWRSRYLMLAPHRLGFFLAMVLLVASGAWWALVQVSRISDGALSMHFGLSPSLLHAAVMVFGFIPLFFSGFLFTAGPKWLGVEPWETRALRPALVLQAGGWLVWLAGGGIGFWVGVVGGGGGALGDTCPAARPGVAGGGLACMAGGWAYRFCAGVAGGLRGLGGAGVDGFFVLAAGAVQPRRGPGACARHWRRHGCRGAEPAGHVPQSRLGRAGHRPCLCADRVVGLRAGGTPRWRTA